MSNSLSPVRHYPYLSKLNSFQLVRRSNQLSVYIIEGRKIMKIVHLIILQFLVLRINAFMHFNPPIPCIEQEYQINTSTFYPCERVFVKKEVSGLWERIMSERSVWLYRVEEMAGEQERLGLVRTKSWLADNQHALARRSEPGPRHTKTREYSGKPT